MALNKNINDQLKVIYNAIGLLPKINGTYLTQRRDTTHEQTTKDQLQTKKSQQNFDLDKLKRKLTYQLKKHSFINDREKKHVTSFRKQRRSVTETGAESLEQQLKAEAQQQKLHVVKLSEFLRLKTRQVIVWNNYKNCLSKLHSKRQREASDRSIQQSKQKKVNYFIPEINPTASPKSDPFKIKINKCDMHEVDNSEKRINKSKCEKKYSFNERARMKNNKKKEGQILPKGEKLITQVCNETKLNRWEYNETKFLPYKKKIERLNDSWGMDQDEIYL